MKVDLKRENVSGVEKYTPPDYPQVCVYKKLPDSLKVGSKIKGEFSGKIVTSRNSRDENSFEIEFHNLDVDIKKFEDMNDSEQREVIKGNFYKKIKE